MIRSKNIIKKKFQVTYLEWIMSLAIDFLISFMVQMVTAGKGKSTICVALAPIDTITGVSFHFS